MKRIIPILCFTSFITIAALPAADPAPAAPAAGADAKAPALKSTVELLAAIEAAGEQYYDHYHANPPTSENYIVVNALTGKTRDKQSFLDVPAAQISANGELLDEWGTPLRFLITQSDSKPVVGWSAGKDKIFGTADDVNKPKPEEIPGAEGQ